MAGMSPVIGAEPSAPTPTARLTENQEIARNLQFAAEIWSAAVDLSGTIAAGYLAGRKLVLPEGISGRVLRFHPRCPFDGRRGPALLALYRHIHTDEPRGIHRRALTPDGRKIGKPLALGAKAGCAIKLTDHADVEHGLHCGEGVETTIAGMMLGFAPAWALGDTGNLRSFPVLAGVDALTILVDHDANAAGQVAAAKCFDRWTAVGREVWSLVPDAVGADINDIVLGGAG
jgi:putative DNA primase/helicase